MSELKRYIPRIVLITVFIVIDVILGSYWLRLQSEERLIPVKNFLTTIHPTVSKTILGEILQNNIPETFNTNVTLTSTEIFDLLNQKRSSNNLDKLTFSTDLSFAASEVVKAVLENNVSFEGVDSSKIIATTLQKRKLENMSLYHDTLIGPKTILQLQKYWENDSDHNKMVGDVAITSIGIATGSAVLGDQQEGIIVTIYAKKQQKEESIKVPKNEKITFPYISNTDVILALNAYRATHKVHELVEHPKLCEYAQMRVDDLIAYGGLDNHEGFKKDFEDAQNLPKPIQEYPGGAIGENLAYQYCRNMTTGESFIAPTATALIEWCFDSSTKGHREAQLNTRYNNVCSRSKNGYFVVIFGE